MEYNSPKDGDKRERQREKGVEERAGGGLACQTSIEWDSEHYLWPSNVVLQ